MTRQMVDHHENTPLIGAHRPVHPDTAALLDRTPHKPAHPSWDCATCQQPWPCPTARAQLKDAYQDDRIGLATHMATALIDAATDLTDLPPKALYDRFIAWTRYRPLTTNP